MKKQVKIQRGGLWESFTISVNSVFKNNDIFRLILEEALVSLSLAQKVEGFFICLVLSLLHVTLASWYL